MCGRSKGYMKHLLIVVFVSLSLVSFAGVFTSINEIADIETYAAISWCVNEPDVSLLVNTPKGFTALETTSNPGEVGVQRNTAPLSIPESTFDVTSFAFCNLPAGTAVLTKTGNEKFDAFIQLKGESFVVILNDDIQNLINLINLLK